MKSEKECYKYNSIYKFFVHALEFDPPQYIILTDIVGCVRNAPYRYISE